MKKVTFVCAATLLLSTQLNADPAVVFVNGPQITFNEPFDVNTHPIRSIKDNFYNYSRSQNLGYWGPYFVYKLEDIEAHRMIHQGGNHFISNRYLTETGDKDKMGSGGLMTRYLPFNIGGRDPGRTYRIYVKQWLSYKTPDLLPNPQWRSAETRFGLNLLCGFNNIVNTTKVDLWELEGSGWKTGKSAEISTVITPDVCPENNFVISFGINNIQDLVYENLELTILE